MVPFDSQDLKGVVYVWIGGLAEHEDAVVAEKIAYKMYQVSSTLLTICINNPHCSKFPIRNCFFPLFWIFINFLIV